MEIQKGHPWVFKDSIVKQNREGQAGDIAILFHEKTNKFLGFGLYDPESIIRVRMLHVGASQELNASFFDNKLNLAFAKRQPLLDTDTTAYRLLFGENDDFPGLICDVYNTCIVLKVYTSSWLPHLPVLCGCLQELLSPDVIILRTNRIVETHLQKKGTFVQGQVLYGELASEEVSFKEHGLRFKANLVKGHKTGYFLDHRANRLEVRNLAKGRRVLDLFAYAGGFSVNAAVGGAKTVATVDISKQSLSMAVSNMKLNDQDHLQYETIASDVFEFLTEQLAKKSNYDLVILDPPSFAKKNQEIPKAILSYRRLIRNCIKICAKNAILLSASCSSRITAEEYFGLVLDELSKSGRKFDILKKTKHDIDHPEKIRELSYLKSIYIHFL